MVTIWESNKEPYETKLKQKHTKNFQVKVWNSLFDHLAFNDLALRREFYQLRYQQFGAIDLLSAAIQRISAKISEVENIKSVTLKTQPILISEWDMIAVLIGTLPPEYDPEIKMIECKLNVNFELAVEEL